MKKHSFREKISYFFDRILSKNPISMILLLFTFTMTCVLVLGTIAYFISDDGGWLYQLWMGLMHTIDTGNLAGNDTANVPYLILMSLATLCGLFVTSVLIGIITTGFESKLEDLKKGNSAVQACDHTTIIGFNSNIYTILSELIEANRSRKKAHIVVLGDIPKEEMEDAIDAHIKKTYTTQIICRSGRLYEYHSLELCSIEDSRSVIVNVDNDAETIKILLALSAYLKDKTLYNKDLAFVTTIEKQETLEPARIASENRVVAVQTNEAIARIIVNTCRQHGLSQVLNELFDFGGDEMYIENIPQLAGKTFEEALTCFRNATIIGIASDNCARLNPPMDTVIKENDGVVIVEEDDGAYEICENADVDNSVIISNPSSKGVSNNNLVILGTNHKLSIILEEYDKYVSKGTRVTIVDDDLDESLIGTYDNIDISICNNAATKSFLTEITSNDDNNNILLLNDDSNDTEISDSNTLVSLLFLRDIASKTGKTFSITSEMHHAENQRLADTIHVDDFVIGSNFSSLLMAQLSENKNILPIIEDLLDEDGSELYTKPASNYVKLGVPVNMFTLAKSAALKGEVFMGYRIRRDDKFDLQVNPTKDSFITFEEGDTLIVIAED